MNKLDEYQLHDLIGKALEWQGFYSDPADKENHDFFVSIETALRNLLARPAPVTDLTLPSIDILNALDYRAKHLQAEINKLMDKQPEEAEKLQKLVGELIGAGKARKAIQRNKTYLVTEEE
ncbi:hypothetical protein FR773_25730 (plasmid) [Leclercia adecarboxylata]|uniref:hypothetical protein n=1 Tax=Leclercia adecarboxylata TaxID=83655 RepID=UPI0012A873C6|nr:hypothetical protein [Leclercia adecarboxylata]QFH68044.1 hypothetical protein FR773_25730 [Leclercia adecarboxylata]